MLLCSSIVQGAFALITSYPFSVHVMTCLVYCVCPLSLVFWYSAFVLLGFRDRILDVAFYQSTIFSVVPPHSLLL